MNFGIMQGRLTKAPLDKDLDWFPDHNWSEEFSIAHSIGFDHIELIIDRYKSKYNPILADDGKKKIKELSLKYAVNINHVCINSIIEETILSDMTLCDIKKRLIDFSELLKETSFSISLNDLVGIVTEKSPSFEDKFSLFSISSSLPIKVTANL